MSLQEIEIKQSYRTSIDKIPTDFYIPLLCRAVNYKRAVGFFSSTVLSKIYTGVSALANKGGTIQIVASPKLSEEDIEAIRKGYELRDKILKNAVMREMSEPKNLFERSCLNQLANLIADGILDIRIAFTEKSNNIGMYHEKMGLISDDKGNTVAFSGSMNESLTAVSLNYESIDVFCSWKNEEQNERVLDKQAAFSAIWNNNEPDITVLEFPELTDEIIKKYKCEKIEHYQSFDEEIETMEDRKSRNNKSFVMPDWFAPYDYQSQAIDEWEKHNYRGIFDMATGTGKTLTALGALSRLHRQKDNHIATVIVCPYIHLVKQWLEDINAFGIHPIICNGTNPKWRREFMTAVRIFNAGISDICVITTNATIAMDDFQSLIDKLNGEVCIVVDEAHNFGAAKQISCMKNLYNYRLALSATLVRHHDDYGTQRLFDFFGEICIEYSLKMAIDSGYLTPYYYYPLIVTLDDDERDKYNILTEKIVNIMRNCKKDDPLPKTAEQLLIERARIIAGARNKLNVLKSLIEEKYTKEHNLLIYCGATKVLSSDYEGGNPDDFEMRQIEAVNDILGNQLGMSVRKFTSEESLKERERIKNDFAEGDMLQAVVAIKCLDEGVNIPCIKTAFILASSTNPKEYVQRRGRVLRKAKGKKYAVIYDFITLPRPLEDIMKGRVGMQSEVGLVKRELERLTDFACYAENSRDALELQATLEEYYKLNYKGVEDCEY